MNITKRIDAQEFVFDAGRSLFSQIRNDIECGLAKQKIYRQTYAELSRLTDRELADIGMHRSLIKRIAMEAANGK